MSIPTPKNILVAPLNWGLGHASRCIPIIKALQDQNFIPIIASDGNALELLKKEFPYIKTLELPSYQIEYPKNKSYFKWKIILNSPKILKAIWEEKRLVGKWIAKYNIEGIISDNRLGVISNKVPSVFITHQLNVLTGNTTWLSSLLHQNVIRKFVECWVPDINDSLNLGGTLSHSENSNLNIKYIGPLSRMHLKKRDKKYDLMIILSGPEPQRELLEEKLKIEIRNYKGKILFIQGIIEREQNNKQTDNVTFYNFMNSRQLEQALNESEIILCRSGYTSIMDLSKLNKKAFFIPTPGQYEQEYLADKLKKEGLVPYSKQEQFTIKDLEEISNYKGLQEIKFNLDWSSLFSIFR
jgi:uncharacterized protein (TIGR00661 family)